MSGLIHEPVTVEAPAETGLVRNLRVARGIIENGWCQGHYNFFGQHCLVGAIGAATESEEIQDMMYDLFDDILGVGIEKWNDTPGRTKEEVLQVIDMAISRHT